MNKSVTCKKCGVDGLFWRKSKAGHFYLVESDYVQFGERASKLIPFAHQCKSVTNMPKSFNEIKITELRSLISKMQKALDSDILESDKVVLSERINDYEQEIANLSN